MVSGAAVGGFWINALIVFLGINSVLSLGYYAPLVNRMYRLKSNDQANDSGKPAISQTLAASLILLTIVIIFFGLFPSVLEQISQSAGDALMSMFYQE